MENNPVKDYASQIVAAERFEPGTSKPDTVDPQASRIITAAGLERDFAGVPGAPEEPGMFSGHNGWRWVVGALGAIAVAAAATVSSPIIAVAALCAGGRLLYSAIADDFSGSNIAVPLARAAAFGLAGALVPFSPIVAVAAAVVAETSIVADEDGKPTFRIGSKIFDEIVQRPLPILLFAGAAFAISRNKLSSGRLGRAVGRFAGRGRVIRRLR